MAINIFQPTLPEGSSYTANPQRVMAMKQLADTLKTMAEDAQKQQQIQHEEAIVEQIVAGKPLTGTRPQQPMGVWDRMTAPFRSSAPYTGRMLPIEAEYKLRPVMEAIDERQKGAELQRDIRLEQAKMEAKAEGPEKMAEIDKIKYKALLDMKETLKKEKAGVWYAPSGKRSREDIDTDIRKVESEIVELENKSRAGGPVAPDKQQIITRVKEMRDERWADKDIADKLKEKGLNPAEYGVKE